jgi:hypothetical protein
MKFVFQPVYFVIMLAFMQHFTHVHCYLINFEIVDQIRNAVHQILLPKQKQDSVLIPFTTTPLPTVQHSTYGIPPYIPGSSEGAQRQVEASTLPQESVNSTLQEGLEGRAMIDAPLINGKCENGYKMANGRCRKMFGRRRRRR